MKRVVFSCFLHESSGYLLQYDNWAVRPGWKTAAASVLLAYFVLFFVFSFIHHSGHHCRLCGNVCCATCSSHTAVLPNLYDKRPVRVCFRCHEIIAKSRVASIKANGGNENLDVCVCAVTVSLLASALLALSFSHLLDRSRFVPRSITCPLLCSGHLCFAPRICCQGAQRGSARHTICRFIQRRRRCWQRWQRR